MPISKLDPSILYCDASATMGERFTVVAGAVASAQDWIDFDVEWSKALKDNGLRYFRMSEFANSFGQFKSGWKKNENRRRDFFKRFGTDHR